MDKQRNKLSNPLQACSEIFYRPKAVFDTLSKVNNWSWIPFIIVVVTVTLPTYLYFQLTDITWLIDQIARAELPDASPAEIENFKRSFPPELIHYSAYAVPIVLVVIHAIVAGFLNFATRSDESNVQGYTDWYGATWWIAMPQAVNGLIALIVLVTYDAGSQIPLTAPAPLSIAFIFGMELTDPLISLFSNIRLDTIWAVFIATYCINTWTSFSIKKSAFFGTLAVAIYVVISMMV